MQKARKKKSSSRSGTSQHWIVERTPANKDFPRSPAAWVHMQARTADQFSSFAAVVPDDAPMTRIKGGVADVFSLSYTNPASGHHVTINLVGKIDYKGDWPTT